MKHFTFKKILFYVMVAMIVISLQVVDARAEERCLTCHSEEISNSLKDSVHSQFSCTTCHQGYTDKLPHPARELTEIDTCGTCHSNVTEMYRESVHGQAGVDCTSCHEGPHEIKKTEDRLSSVHRLNEPETCAKCHEDSVPYRSYKESFHGIGNHLGSEKNATCTDCHTSHFMLPETDSRSSVHQDNVADACAECHGVAAVGFAQGKEHFEFTSSGYGAPMYWTMKFFTWLTIIAVTLVIVHMELELYRRLRNILSEERR